MMHGRKNIKKLVLLSITIIRPILTCWWENKF